MSSRCEQSMSTLISFKIAKQILFWFALLTFKQSREQGDKRKHWQWYNSDPERGKGKSWETSDKIERKQEKKSEIKAIVWLCPPRPVINICERDFHHPFLRQNSNGSKGMCLYGAITGWSRHLSRDWHTRKQAQGGKKNRNTCNQCAAYNTHTHRCFVQTGSFFFLGWGGGGWSLHKKINKIKLSQKFINLILKIRFLF